MLIDTHAHLNFKDFQKDLDQVIKRSIDAGVNKIICVSSNVGDAKQAIEIARKYPGVVFASVGIHPQQTDPENTDSPEIQIKKLTELAQQKEVVAIGECGLDYSPAPTNEKDRTKEEQFCLFQEQIELALKLKIPLIVHSRKAFEDTIKLISNYTLDAKRYTLTGVFHCYSAGRKGIELVNQLGFFFGVDGNLTYDQGLRNIFKEIPLNKIILETDSPFLTPIPFRGQRSEPAHVKIIAECLAKIKKVQLNEVAQVTTLNAEKIFDI